MQSLTIMYQGKQYNVTRERNLYTLCDVQFGGVLHEIMAQSQKLDEVSDALYRLTDGMYFVSASDETTQVWNNDGLFGVLQ